MCARRAVGVRKDLPHKQVRLKEVTGSPLRDHVSSCAGARDEFRDCHSVGRNGDFGRDDVAGASGKMAGEKALSGGGSWDWMYFQWIARVSDDRWDPIALWGDPLGPG